MFWLITATLLRSKNLDKTYVIRFYRNCTSVMVSKEVEHEHVHDKKKNLTAKTVRNFSQPFDYL